MTTLADARTTPDVSTAQMLALEQYPVDIAFRKAGDGGRMRRHHLQRPLFITGGKMRKHGFQWKQRGEVHSWMTGGLDDWIIKGEYVGFLVI